ncbi:hypothetical protein AN957_09960 [Cytobacillus solani]|uniref:DUF2577 domain-containing protein n=2 Tax=Cytobacillus solani TaxID=1637975 RepID=A0A0Q3QVM9_9BACI|nr:hypothetical protein AN957_09960 [Cytobacillus solani]
MMKKHGHNTDVDVELATVVAPPPSLQIRLNSDNLTLDKSDLIIAEHLTEHTRKVSITGGSVSVSDAAMTVKSPLSPGDQVIVVSANEGQLYYVLDKAVV